MITRLKSDFNAYYKVTTKKDLTEFAKKYLKACELKEMLDKVNNYKNYEWVNDDNGYIGFKRKSQRTYLVEII